MNLIKRKRRRKILTTTFVFLLFSAVMMMGFSTVLGKNITLNIDGKKTEIITYSSNVEDFLKTEDIVLLDNQSLNIDRKQEIKDGMEIKIDTAKSIKILDGTKVKVVETIGGNVSDILKSLNIKLNETDKIKPSVKAPAKEGMTIEITRVNKQVTDVNIELDFNTITNENKNLPKGEKKILVTGEKGLRIDTVETTFVNGTPTQNITKKSEIIKNPIDQVEEIGTKEEPKELPKDSPKNAKLDGKRVVKSFVMQATAYDPTAGSLTAMGTKARVGAVAVDPKVIPLGSKLFIESMDGFPSYGYAVAEDTGGAIKGKRIDLFYNTNAQANKFGRRNVKVYVLK